MELFDKIKNIANQVTGGGATVTLTVEGSSVKSPIKVHIAAVIKDAPILIEKVYLYVKSIEKIVIPSWELSSGSGRNHSVNVETDIFQKLEFIISSAQTLEEGRTYNWIHEFTLPSGVHPSYALKYSDHKWQFYAGLDAKGNDPDSGWITAVLS